MIITIVPKAFYVTTNRVSVRRRGETHRTNTETQLPNRTDIICTRMGCNIIILLR